MKSLKTLFFGTTVALGFGTLLGTSAYADTLYTVKSGDTLSSISHSFVGSNDLIQQIAKDNNIANIDMISVGQQLNIKSDNSVKEATEEFVYEAPAEVTYQEAPVVEETTSTSTYAGNSSSAKEWIAQRESGGSYTATNGYHIGRYQLDPNYLNGDHSAANQERVADQYVADRYGSWENAQSFWMSNGWY